MRLLSPLLILSLLLAADARAAQDFEGYTLYFGELHAHTGYSLDGGSTDLGDCAAGGGCGNAADFFTNARDVAGLDFAAITDHINGPHTMQLVYWPDITALAEAGHDPDGGFVSLLGAEVRVSTPEEQDFGHKNLIFFAEQVPEVSVIDMVLAGEPDDCDELWARVQGMEAAYGPLLFIAHHPAATAPMPTDWACHDEILSPVVEIYSTHGNSRDQRANDDWDPLWSMVAGGGTVNEALAADWYGHHLGIIGGTDFHDTWPGLVCHRDLMHPDQPFGGSLTGVALDGGVPFSRTTLYHGIRRRHTYATTGPTVPVLLTLQDDDGAQVGMMGDIVMPPPDQGATIRLSFDDALQPYVDSVQLYDSNRQTHLMDQVADGEYELEVGSVTAPWFGYGILTIGGGSWYADQGVECEDGGDDDLEKIWTSPIWIEELDESDDDGDGYSEADGDCDDFYAPVNPDAVEELNSLDDDCDGIVDEDTDAWDGDGDGYSPLDGDCDDLDDAVYPDADDVCDQVLDNDCDGETDPSEADEDGDGYSVCGGDCDDLDETVHPGADELANGLDDDCDGEVDEDTAADDDDSADDDDDDTVADDDDCSCSVEGPAAPAAVLPLALLAGLLLHRRR